ncbi:MAG TPA: FecR family protein, partial [Polyangiaceae bacterium]|nr:FecR family protein [Polyangiaceae bacterium]
MNVPRYASQVARLLSGTLGNVGAPPDNRTRGIATIERAIAARQKARVLRFWLLGAAAVALIASAGAWFGSPVASSSTQRQPAESVSVTLSARGAGATLSPGHTALHDGDRLFVGGGVSVNKEGSAMLDLSTGTRLELEGDASVVANDLDRQQRFYLSKGALRAKVAKLSTGQRFVVETPDAEIEVRGTEFRLEV